jgi:pSer/pThr/pTyr-binding forkhead associated (FHA) protein
MPKLRVYLSEDNQVAHDLTEERITLGRLPDNALVIEHDSVSSHHGEFVLENGVYHFHDNDSTNGTFVNGEQVTDAVLKDGDQIRFGQVETVFMAEDTAGGAQPLPTPARGAGIPELGQGSARPASFTNASPFPKPKEKTDSFTYAAAAVAALGALGFLAAIAVSLMMQPPV